jgi:sugar fermentation stimulation protein A
MIITNIFTGKYMERPNRFTVKFQNKDRVDLAHLRDPGRLKELLTPEADLLLRPALNGKKRKTQFDVLAVSYKDQWVLINSGFHSDIAAELIDSGELKDLKGYSIEKREYTYGNSRLDFLLTNPNNEKLLLEVKGCTLVENGLAKFPDAPTSRGKRHVEELIKAREEGLEASVHFLILRDDAVVFSPNWEMDPEFSQALVHAQEKGVKIIASTFKIIYKKECLEMKPLKQIKIMI